MQEWVLYKTALPLDIPFPYVFLSKFPLHIQNVSFYTESSKKGEKREKENKAESIFPWRTLQHLACRSITATLFCFTWLYSYIRWLTFAVRTVHNLRGPTTVNRLHPLLRRLLYEEGLLAATPHSRLKECWLFTTTCWWCSYSSHLETVFFTSRRGKCHVVIKRISSPVFCWKQHSTYFDKRVHSSATQTLGLPV